MSTSKQTMTVGELRGILDDCEDDTRVRLDIPVLADTYDCVGVTVEAKAYMPDEIIFEGYND